MISLPASMASAIKPIRATSRPLNFSRSGPYFAAFFLVALIAFWPTYLSQAFGSSTSYTHLHAVSASLWMLMLIAQPLAIRTKRLVLHRVLGRAHPHGVPTTWE